VITPPKYKGADKVWRPRAGVFWWKLAKLEHLIGGDRFPMLTKLMAGLLSIPADSERGFSILGNIHTDQRPSLKQDTLISLMTIKFNSNNIITAMTPVSVNPYFQHARRQLL
jgi:hypothetical protein